VARNVVAGVSGSEDFPFLELNAALSRHLRRPSSLTAETIDAVMDLFYGNKLTFLLLTLLYDEQRWGTMAHHVDHIVPSARTARKALMAGNVPYSKVEMISSAANRIGNLELLTASENLEKNAKPFETWIATRDRSFLKRHHIPDNEHLRSVMMLPEFVKERERLIRERLASLQFDPAADSIALGMNEDLPNGGPVDELL
jgi:hypothetical protein